MQERIKRPWGRGEIEKLTEMYREGYSLHDIATKLERSFSSVKSMAQRLNLHRPNRSEKHILIEPVKPSKRLLSHDEVFCFMSGIIERLQSKPISPDELKMLAVAIKAATAYARRWI